MFWGKKKREEQRKKWIEQMSQNIGIETNTVSPDGDITKQEFDSLDDFLAHYQEIIQQAVVEAPKEQPCDVFLCHNSKEKQAVLAIGKKLKARGIVPWIDSERIVAGSVFDEVIKQAMRESRSAAIFAGPAGFGRYQQYEIRAFMEACMSNKLRVIPVLLPGCDGLPESAIFLRQHHFVRFAHIDDQDALNELIRTVQTA